MNKRKLAGRSNGVSGMMLRLGVMVAAAAVTLAGCQAGNNATGSTTSAASSSRTQERTAPVPRLNTPIEPLDAQRIGYRVQWPKNLQLQRGESIQHAAIVDDLVLTVERPRNLLTATSLRTGETRWRRIVGRELEQLHEPFGLRDRIMINSGERLFSFRPADGEQTYVTNLDYPVNHRPTMMGNLAIFGGANGRVFAHHVRDGFAHWEYQLTSRIPVRPAAAPGGHTVFAVDSSGVFAMLEGSSGTLVWKGRTFAPVTGQPAVGTAVFLASHDQTLYALERVNGDDRWKFRETEPLREGPILMGTQVVQPLGSRGLVVVDGASGEEMWRLSETAQPFLIRDEQMLLNMGRSIRVVDARTGETLDEVPTKPLQTVLVDQGTGTLILVTRAGELQRLDPR